MLLFFVYRTMLLLTKAYGFIYVVIVYKLREIVSCSSKYNIPILQSQNKQN